MKERLYNVGVRRPNGNTYVSVTKADSFDTALQLAREKVGHGDIVLGGSEVGYRGDRLWCGNFLVSKESDNVFCVYRCTVHGNKIGKVITKTENFNDAVKKAKLLERGFSECLRNEKAQ